MKIEIRPSAIKDLKKLDNVERKKIHEKVVELANFPDVRNIKKLTNFEPAYRLRLGSYRVLFDVVGRYYNYWQGFTPEGQLQVKHWKIYDNFWSEGKEND